MKLYQIIHFWKLEINSYLMVYFFFEKDLALHMFKMSRGSYTGGNFKQNIWKKIKGNWGPYLRSWFDKLTNWYHFIFTKIYNATTACITNLHLYNRKMFTNRKMVNFYYKLCHYRSMKNAYWVNVCFICSKQCTKIISSGKQMWRLV